jgi:bifunctional DNA-binding transcriptional regulator/antitoxin component of YhaV-PrlF toxin-antitoxin module
MGLTLRSQIGKKLTIYLPKSAAQEAGLEEGMKILITVEDNRLVIEPLPDPLELALSGKKFARMTTEEVESISLEEQSKHQSGSS